MRFFRRFPSLLLGLGLTACAGANFNAFGPLKSESTYDTIYPTWIELCAVSGIDKQAPQLPSIHGGPGGHSVLFLHGACRDRGEHYPVLRACNPDDPKDPPGIGISANAHFSNANWIATDGPDFFYQGDLKPGERLDWTRYEQTQHKAQALGILDGVKFHPEIMQNIPPGLTYDQYKYELSISTDYALAFGRGRFCARTSVTQAQMRHVIASLNDVNRPYRAGKAIYEWNVLRNNCTHLCHNAVAAADLWDENKINRFVLKAAFDFPVPKNDLMNLVERQDNTDLTDLASIWRDPASRQLVIQDHRLPSEPGTLVTSAPIWPENNVYKTSQALIFYQDPIFGTYRDRFADTIKSPHYRDLSSNFRYFDRLYEQALQQRRPAAWWITQNNDIASQQDAFIQFYEEFYRILIAEQTNLKEKENEVNASSKEMLVRHDKMSLSESGRSL